MGLLDMFDNGDAQLGLGLLGAAAPRADGAGFGQRLMEGVGSAQAMRTAQMQRQMQQLQFQSAMRKNDLINQVLAGTMGQQPQQGFTPNPTASGALPSTGQLGSGTFGVLQTDGGQTDMPAPGAPRPMPMANNGVPREAMAYDLAFNDGKNIGAWNFERNKPNIEMVNGVAIDKNHLPAGFSMPTVSQNGTASQLVADPSAPGGYRVIAPNGAVDTAEAYKTADLRATNKNTIADPSKFIGADGKPFVGTLDQLINEVNTPRMRTNPGSLPVSPELQAAIEADAKANGIDNPVANFRGKGIGVTGNIASAVPASGMSFQTPVQAATNAAAVVQNTKPQLDYSTQAAQGLQKMGENINGRLAESQDLLKRITQSREALTKFKAGGGTDSQAAVAQAAQAFGAPQALVDRIAGGNLAAVQEFQKYAAQEALHTMQQSLASDNGPAAKGNRIAMELFIKNNPNITTDPRAVERIFDFQTKLHNDALKQSDFYSNYISDPSNVKDAAVFGNKWAHQQIDSGMVVPKTTATPTQSTPAQSGRVATLADISATAKSSGKTTAQVTADLRRAGFTIGGQ